MKKSPKIIKVGKKLLPQPIVLRDRKAAYLNNDCRNFIARTDITFTCRITYHMVSISTLVNLMADVKSVLNEDEFFGDTIDTPK